MQILSIGRDVSNNIVLNDNFVSRHHAQLILTDNGRVLLKDLGSANGTFVNGNKISEYYLNSGDVVKCASVFLNWQQYTSQHLSQNQSQEIPNPVIPSSNVKLRKKPVLISTYIVIGLLFLMPFCDLKCGGGTIKSLSGFELMTGGEINDTGKDMFSFQDNPGARNSEKVDPDVFIIIPFLAAILGIIILIIKNITQFKISFYSSMIGFLSLIAFMIHANNKVQNPVTIEFDIAFWLTMLCFLIAIILSYLEGFKSFNNRIS
jgi:pSer/pThr/pTyr-binding forkhead associated (FHA) protein